MKLNKIRGKRIPKEYQKRGVNLRFLFDSNEMTEQELEEKYPYTSQLHFFDGKHLIGTTSMGMEDRSYVPSVKEFLEWYEREKPVGYTEYKRDGILRCLNYAYDLRPYV